MQYTVIQQNSKTMTNGTSYMIKAKIMPDYKESQNTERDLNQHYSGYDISKYVKNHDKI